MIKTRFLTDHLEIETKAGTFFADAEEAEETGRNSIYLSFRPKGFDQAVDIAAIRDMPVGGDPEGIEMLLFSNLASEDETEKVVLTKEEIQEQMLEGGYHGQQ